MKQFISLLSSTSFKCKTCIRFYFNGSPLWYRNLQIVGVNKLRGLINLNNCKRNITRCLLIFVTVAFKSKKKILPRRFSFLYRGLKDNNGTSRNRVSRDNVRWLAPLSATLRIINPQHGRVRTRVDLAAYVMGWAEHVPFCMLPYMD